MKAELAELSALKTNLETATCNLSDQFTRLTERLDRIERAETEPNAKRAHIVEAVDRLEKDRRTAMASSAAPVAEETTGTIPKIRRLPPKQNAPRRSCRIGSSMPSAAAGHWSKIAAATSSRSPAAACFPAWAGSRQSSGRATIGSS